MNIVFGNWPASIHSDFEQVKRIESSKKLKKDIVSIDMGKQVLVVRGSGSEPYQTTLSECTCPDFAMRQAPCKHMYCLAGQLGLMDSLPAYNKKKSSFRPADEIKRYRSLYESGEISGGSYGKICSVLAKIK